MESQTVLELKKILRGFGGVKGVGFMKKAQLIVEIRRRRAVQQLRQIEADARSRNEARRQAPRNLATREFRTQLQGRVAERQQRPLMMQEVRVLRTSRRVIDRDQFQVVDMPVIQGEVNGFVSWELNYQISATIGIKTGRFRFTGTENELRTQVDEAIALFLAPLGEPYIVLFVKVRIAEITNPNRSLPFAYTQSRMLSPTPIDISVNIFNNTIKIKPTEENCVKSHLRANYKKITIQKKDPIGQLGDENGVHTDEIKAFCVKYNIRMVAFNIYKEPIAQYYPEHNDHRLKGLYFISHENHIYPIKNEFLERVKEPVHSVLLDSEPLYSKFNDIVKSNVLPGTIRLKDDIITSFKHEGVLYFSNPEYKDCEKILDILGLKSKMTPKIRYTNILYEIEKAYSTASSSLNSFLPISNTKQAFWYNKENVDTTRPTVSIDKNKAYSSILKDLPYLLSVDYRTQQLQDFPFKLTEEALYIATPEIPNILMTQQDIYSGSLLLYCKGKINFTIQEKLTCVSHPNVYSKIIEDLFTMCDPNVVKKIIVKTIGTFQTEAQVKDSIEATIISKENHNPDYAMLQVGDHLLELRNQKFVQNIHNRKPIAIQIKDRMAVLLYEKMLELKLSSDDILQINTDSITFYESSTKTPIKTGNTLDAWKIAEYTSKKGSVFLTQEPFKTMRVIIPNDNELKHALAGAGKSHHIRHNMDLTNSIILSSKHSALTQHRENNLNANVIQKYQFQNSIPTEDHLIIEEIGIFDKYQWDILYKCFLLGKKITCLGDFRQLLPVGENATFSSTQFLDMMFSKQTRMDTNYRNNFTPEYYQSLIDSKDPNYLTEQLLKYSTAKPEDAEVIIAYRNVIVDKYNDYMMAYHNNPEVYPMLCKTNELRAKEIYNGFIVRSNEIKPEDKHNFKPAFARTLYNLQGDQVKSYYIAPEDIHWFAQSRSAYTLISRLKQ